MSFSVVSKIVWARKLTFLVVFALITACAIVFTQLVTPMFQSEALLMTTLDRAQRQQTQFPDTLRYQLNSQIYIVYSEDVLRQAISEFGPQRLYPDQKKAWHWQGGLPPNMSAVVAMGANLLRSGNPDEGLSDVDRALLKVKKRLASLVPALRAFRRSASTIADIRRKRATRSVRSLAKRSRAVPSASLY